MNCNFISGYPYYSASQVSIPNRDFDELQSTCLAASKAFIPLFQSLIGILMNCNSCKPISAASSGGFQSLIGILMNCNFPLGG